MTKITLFIALLASFVCIHASTTIVSTKPTTTTTFVQSRISTVTTKKSSTSIAVSARRTGSSSLLHHTISRSTVSRSTSISSRTFHDTTSSAVHTRTQGAKCVMPTDSSYDQAVLNPSFEYSYDGTDTGYSWPWDLSNQWKMPDPFNMMHDSAAIWHSTWDTHPGEDGSHYAMLSPTNGPPSYIVQYINLYGGVSYELEYSFFLPSNGLNTKSKCALDVRLYYTQDDILDTTVDHIEFTHLNLKPYQGHYTIRKAPYKAGWYDGDWAPRYLQVAWKCTGWLDDDGFGIGVDNITFTAKCP